MLGILVVDLILLLFQDLEYLLLYELLLLLGHLNWSIRSLLVLLLLVDDARQSSLDVVLSYFFDLLVLLAPSGLDRLGFVLVVF